MNTKNVLIFFVSMMILSSCASVRKINYFQDLQPGVAEQIAVPSEIKIRPNDKISIVVNSKNPELANLFNLPIVSHRIGASSESSLSGSSQQVSGYTINKEGDIDFPVLGKVYIADLTREEVASRIKNELINNNLVMDPVVTVEFMNLCISILGEVNNPGRFNIDRDKITILDAISMAGDLTIYGKRDAVYVLRDEQGQQVPYLIDLTSAGQLYASPVFYLQQNDVVYVEPNDVRARQSTINGNNVLSTSFWISAASLLTTIIVLFVK
jgi:Periplasmic protein involved in polysaccharide export